MDVGPGADFCPDDPLFVDAEGFASAGLSGVGILG